jgi:hypothetical protein
MRWQREQETYDEADPSEQSPLTSELLEFVEFCFTFKCYTKNKAVQIRQIVLEGEANIQRR